VRERYAVVIGRQEAADRTPAMAFDGGLQGIAQGIDQALAVPGKPLIQCVSVRTREYKAEKAG